MTKIIPFKPRSSPDAPNTEWLASLLTPEYRQQVATLAHDFRRQHDGAALTHGVLVYAKVPIGSHRIWAALETVVGSEGHLICGVRSLTAIHPETKDRGRDPGVGAVCGGFLSHEQRAELVFYPGEDPYRDFAAIFAHHPEILAHAERAHWDGISRIRALVHFAAQPCQGDDTLGATRLIRQVESMRSLIRETFCGFDLVLPAVVE